MSFISTAQSIASDSSFRGERSGIFQDMPLLDKLTRLTIMELRHSDRQIINELVYRWCRILTRATKSHECVPGTSDTAMEQTTKVLIIDMIGALDTIRLTTVLKNHERRMRMVTIAKGCKINSTFPTLNSHIGRQSNVPSSLKLVVIYQDEFFIVKTLDLIHELVSHSKCQILLVVPRLDLRDHALLDLGCSHQTLRCDFVVDRNDISFLPSQKTESYRSSLRKIYFTRHSSNKTLPSRVEGELHKDGLVLQTNKPAMESESYQSSINTDICCTKKFKSH